MFKRGGFDSYDIEASLFKLIKDKLSSALGVEVKQGDFLQIGFDENKNKLTIQMNDFFLPTWPFVSYDQKL
mgnify:CR=1 FL=1